MKLVPHFRKHSLVAIAAVVFVSSTLVYGQSPQFVQADKPVERRLNMLVLGDSITWGQGLMDEHKAWYQIKNWLQKTAGRNVRERIEAHSGAVVGSAEGPFSNSVPLDGEVNRALPSVNDQISNALRELADPSQVDLVLVDGCINDVDARRFLNAANTPEEIQKLAQAKCGSLVEALLGRITSSFPNAHVIVTGYFPIISEETSNDFFMRALVKRLYAPEAGAPRLSDKELRARLIAISREWYQASNHWLRVAAGNVETQLVAKGSRQRVVFAEVTFLPEHSFRARDSRLWGFKASFLRKLLLVLTLGKVAPKTNDDQRNRRNASCKEVFKRPAGETKNERKVREGQLRLCRIAAIGHPNRKGAEMYADAISKQLKLLIGDTGWLRDSIAVPGSLNR